jgi:hypothetical protein
MELGVMNESDSENTGGERGMKKHKIQRTTEEPRFDSWQGKGIFLFSTSSRPRRVLIPWEIGRSESEIDSLNSIYCRDREFVEL